MSLCLPQQQQPAVAAVAPRITQSHPHVHTHPTLHVPNRLGRALKVKAKLEIKVIPFPSTCRGSARLGPGLLGNRRSLDRCLRALLAQVDGNANLVRGCHGLRHAWCVLLGFGFVDKRRALCDVIECVGGRGEWGESAARAGRGSAVLQQDRLWGAVAVFIASAYARQEKRRMWAWLAIRRGIIGGGSEGGWPCAQPRHPNQPGLLSPPHRDEGVFKMPSCTDKPPPKNMTHMGGGSKQASSSAFMGVPRSNEVTEKAV